MTTTTTGPGPGARKLLAGVHVVARDDDHVQVGIDPPARVIVRRHPEVLMLLDALQRPGPAHPCGPLAEHVLDRLDAAGLLVRAQHAPPPRGSVALVDQDFGLGGLADLLKAGGVPLARMADRSPPALYVVASRGPLARSTLDTWVGDGAPHLVLAGTGRPGTLRLGPLVEPGTTACLRCVDAHEAVLDPRRPLVVEQLAALPAPPLDPLTAALAVAWAAREAAAFASGRRPLTWSATVDLCGADLGAAPLVRSWTRHPHCGCAWDLLPY